MELREWRRPSWTFHAKGSNALLNLQYLDDAIAAGMWWYAPNTAHPCLTFVGSPNFGFRSAHRDLEAQVLDD